MATGPPLYSYGPDHGQEGHPEFHDSKVHLPFGNYFQPQLLVDVTVTDVQSPDCFHIRNIETTGDLEYMEQCMNEFYVPYWDANGSIDPDEILVGGIYSVYVAEEDWWYRGRVDFFDEDRNKPTQVVVQLMDHGTLEIVDFDCILPLRKIYYQLPIQAAIGTLQTVYNSLPWSLEEIRQFKTDVEGKRFQAFITEHRSDFEDQVFPYVTLVLLETVDGVKRQYSPRSSKSHELWTPD